MKMHLLTLTSLSLLASVPASAADTVTLNVVVTGIKTTTGVIRACVFKTATAFPNCEKGDNTVKITVPANGPTVKFAIPGVTPGTGAVSLFIDADDSGKMKTGFMGIPKSGVGFSNNAWESFGAPKFDKAKIAIGANTTTEIKIKYY
jgi:uncharacterized protein (DUF2141 family)